MYTFIIKCVSRGVDPAKIVTPFPHVAKHVERAKIVRQQATTGPGMFLGRGIIPGIPPQQVHTRPVIAAGPCPRPAGILPFRLSGQAVATQTQGIRLDLHTSRILATLVRLVALGSPLPATEPVAVSDG